MVEDFGQVDSQAMMNKGQVEPLAIVGVNDLNAFEGFQKIISGYVFTDQMNKIGVIAVTEMDADYGESAIIR